MAVEIYANQPTTTVTSGGTDAPSPGTSQTWTVASSSEFPAASSSATTPTQFHVCDTASGKVSEIIAVTNVSGTTWTVTRGAEGTTPVTHASGFTVMQVTTAGGLEQAATYLNAQTMFGATGNGTTDDTTACQACIDAAAGSVSGVAHFPAGTYLVTNLTVPSNVMVLGDGPGATVFSVSSSTSSGTSVFSLAAEATTRFVTFRDFMIDGNGVSGVTGISVNNDGLSPSTPGFHRLWNLVVENMGGDGYYYENQIETYTIGCLAFQITGTGFNVQNGATDSRWVSCTAGACGSDGFYTSGSNSHYVACKAYYTGYDYTNGDWGTGNGYHVAAVSDYFSAGITFTGCEAQDCANNGWFFDPSSGPINSNSMVACVIDSCNASGGSAASACGIQTSSLVNSSIVGNQVFNRSGGAGSMPWYLSVEGTQDGLVIALNSVDEISNYGVYYVSGYGYTLLEAFQTDLSAVSSLKIPSPLLSYDAVTLSNGTTITFNEAYSAYFASETADVTGIVMGTASTAGQAITILNTSAYTVTFAASGSNVVGGSSVTIPASSAMGFVYDDGWYPVTPSSSGGGGSGGGGAALDALGSISGSVTLDVATYGCFTGTLTGNTTFSFSGSPSTGEEYSFDVFLTQNSTGGYTASWPSSVTWLGGEPVVNATEGALSILTFTTLNGGTSWYGSMALATSFPIPTTDGGTGLSSPAVNELLMGPSSSGGTLQSIASSGTAGYVLTDNGTGSAPTFQAATGSTPADPWLPGDETLSSGTLKAANFDPAHLIVSTEASGAPTANQIMLMRITPRTNITASNIVLLQKTAAAGTSTGTYAGIYSASSSELTLLEQTNDVGTALETIGAGYSQILPLTASADLTAGDTYYVAFGYSGLSTAPVFFCLYDATNRVGSTFFSGGAAIGGRFLQAPMTDTSGVYTLPSTIASSALATTYAISYWAGLS